MNIMKLEDTIIKDFITANPLTGGAIDADSTPTCEVFEDTTDVAILTPTVVKRESKTGNYRVPIAMTTANGFEVGKSYNVIVSVTVNGITAKECIDSFIIDVPRGPNGKVQSDAGNSTTQFKSDRTETTNDYWKKTMCRMVTGNCAGQVDKITAYNGSTKIITVASGFSSIPQANDVYEIINI